MTINDGAANKFWGRRYLQPGLTDETVYALSLVLGSHTVPTQVTIQALDVNKAPLLVQSNLWVRLTTGVLPYAESTNGTIGVNTGTTLVEDNHTYNSAISASTSVKLQSNTSGVFSFAITNATQNQLMGLVIGPCEGCLRSNFTSAGIAYGQVTGCNVTAAGSGYTYGAKVVFSGGGGTGAAATATVVSGAVTAIVMTSQGSGYTSAPTVTIVAEGNSIGVVAGSGATATSSVTFSHA